MPFFAKRLIAALLLAAYAVASVLSSAFHDHQHGASCASHGCATAKVTGHTHGHRCRHHHHGHSHAHGTHDDHHGRHTAQHEAPQQSPKPLHDDHCSACHFLGLATVITPPVEVMDGGEVVSQVTAARPVTASSSVARLWRSRAPPTQG